WSLLHVSPCVLAASRAKIWVDHAVSKCFQPGSGQCFRFTEPTTDGWTYRAVSNIIATQLSAPKEKCRDQLTKCC
ncbi:hypothetical protein V6N11_074908, partial [Hibiscus sabdariffa]